MLITLSIEDIKKISNHCIYSSDKFYIICINKKLQNYSIHLSIINHIQYLSTPRTTASNRYTTCITV